MAGHNSLIFEDMTNSPPPVQVFIGSSAEGLQIAKNLQAELEASPDCVVHRWDIGTFDPGSITLDALIAKANRVDFAILVATGEDTLTTRGMEMAAVRDNIVFEFGLFLGALGRERVYLLSVGDAKLPSDLSGLTRLVYQKRSDGNIRAGLNDAVLRAQDVMRKYGPRKSRIQPNRREDASALVEKIVHDALATTPEGKVLPTQISTAKRQEPEKTSYEVSPNSLATAHKEHVLKALDDEIKWLCSNATDQGWLVIKNNPTMLRLRSPKGKEFTLSRRRPAGTRVDLRKFVAELRANGLRVSQALQGAVEDSPFG